MVIDGIPIRCIGGGSNPPTNSKNIYAFFNTYGVIYNGKNDIPSSSFM